MDESLHKSHNQPTVIGSVCFKPVEMEWEGYNTHFMTQTFHTVNGCTVEFVKLVHLQSREHIPNYFICSKPTSAFGKIPFPLNTPKMGFMIKHLTERFAPLSCERQTHALQTKHVNNTDGELRI